VLPLIKQLIFNETCRTYRSVFLRRPVFIGVTGSCGKTTTKELIFAILSTRFRGQVTPGNCNELWHIARIILRTSPRNDFCILEVGAPSPGAMDLPLSLIRPRIGVVTNVGMDHISQYGSIDNIAIEKSKLVKALSFDGTAVLNEDDARVLEMRNQCAGQVVTFGLSPAASLQAADIQGDWPNRLSFSALCNGQTLHVKTQLCGTHWVPNVLAAMAVGQAMGISLSDAAEAIRSTPPFPGRMSPVTTRDGITFICDETKAPLWTIPAALDFLRRASAKRKILIVGTLSDYRGNSSAKYVDVARRALDVADFVFFASPWASRCLRARRHADDQALRAYANVGELMEFLYGFLRPGDLVYLKGSEKAEDLGRIVSAWNQRAAAIQSDVGANYVPNQSSSSPNTASRLNPLHVIVGLGNPGIKYQHTPHNVGQQALDILADSLQATWSMNELGTVSHAQLDGEPLLLIKPATFINDTGRYLHRVAAQLGFGPANCVLIHDDTNLDIGVVRNRENGSSGGHKGVQSVLVAFQSEGFRRVKIGVGRPTNRVAIPEYVVTPFDDRSRILIAKACREAANRVSILIKSRRIAS
jgi:aminoacyl-tRNA hydrolase